MSDRPAFACDYQRLWDLVRFARGVLLDAGLITLEEYALLCAEASPVPAAEPRDEGFDQLASHIHYNRRFGGL